MAATRSAPFIFSQLASRPAGVPLKLKQRSRIAPFSRLVEIGATYRLEAPRIFEDGERTFVFRRWQRERLAGERTARRRPRRVLRYKPRVSMRFVAVYRPRGPKR